jgi:hypothetical protein
MNFTSRLSTDIPSDSISRRAERENLLEKQAQQLDGDVEAVFSASA